jgi:uncharacterized Zn-finger protein
MSFDSQKINKDQSKQSESEADGQTDNQTDQEQQCRCPPTLAIPLFDSQDSRSSNIIDHLPWLPNLHHDQAPPLVYSTCLPSNLNRPQLIQNTQLQLIQNTEPQLRQSMHQRWGSLPTAHQPEPPLLQFPLQQGFQYPSFPGYACDWRYGQQSNLAGEHPYATPSASGTPSPTEETTKSSETPIPSPPTAASAVETSRPPRRPTAVRRPVGKHKCQECAKGFHRPSNLQVHMRTHTGERPFACPTCSRPFQTKSNCTRHEKAVHRTEASRL